MPGVLRFLFLVEEMEGPKAKKQGQAEEEGKLRRTLPQQQGK